MLLGLIRAFNQKSSIKANIYTSNLFSSQSIVNLMFGGSFTLTSLLIFLPAVKNDYLCESCK